MRFLVGGHNVKMSDDVIVEASGGLWFLAFEGCDCYLISAGLKTCRFLSFNGVLVSSLLRFAGCRRSS